MVHTHWHTNTRRHTPDRNPENGKWHEARGGGGGGASGVGPSAGRRGTEQLRFLSRLSTGEIRGRRDNLFESASRAARRRTKQARGAQVFNGTRKSRAAEAAAAQAGITAHAKTRHFPNLSFPPVCGGGTEVCTEGTNPRFGSRCGARSAPALTSERRARSSLVPAVRCCHADASVGGPGAGCMRGRLPRPRRIEGGVCARRGGVRRRRASG
jgi:hypothetical protein